MRRGEFGRVGKLWLQMTLSVTKVLVEMRMLGA